SWEVFSKGLPNVAFHDLVIQAKAKDLVLGTHGRSIYRANISALQKMNPSLNNEAITLFDTKPVRHSRRWGGRFIQWMDAFESSTSLSFYANSGGSKDLKILSEGGSELNAIKVQADKGFNYANYDMSITEAGKDALMKEDTSIRINKAQNGKYYLPKGKYKIQIGNETTDFEIN
ncbi:MAG: glycosyl hydrolase, partial [Bacteroidia bacterium]|nr:glycosyl hydrolase [Bacteroidia bacterium]